MTTKTEGAVMVPMEVEYQPAWLTWVASATTCLKALGHDVDLADVAGASGYAFVISVSKDLCPSGPTVFDWGGLIRGINMLARSVVCFTSIDCHTGEHICDRTREHAKHVYELVESEIKAGRPCVLWGTYVPEFGVAVGVDDGKYIVKTFRECMKQEQPPIPYDGVDAPGGPYMMGFPSPTNFTLKGNTDKFIVAQAVNLMLGPNPFPGYGLGLDGYDVWIDSIEECKADKFGNAYNTQCYAEGRHFARDFVKKAAGRNEKVKDVLDEAVKHYDDAVEAMDRLAKLFPFSIPVGDHLDDEDTRKEAIKTLKDAKKAEKSAVKALQKSLEMEWEEEKKS